MDRPGHDKKYALNSYKIKRKLKWNYKVSIKKGLRKTFDWYLKNSAYFEKISKKYYKEIWNKSMKNKILITGSSGRFGKSLKKIKQNIN